MCTYEQFFGNFVNIRVALRVLMNNTEIGGRKLPHTFTDRENASRLADSDLPHNPLG